MVNLKSILSRYVRSRTDLIDVSLLQGLARFANEYVPPPRLIPEPSKSGFAKSFDGTRIYWELHGPDPAPGKPRPMVFCYGLVCSMNQWREQLARYRTKHPCILLDYRGHHKSEFPEDPARMNLSALAKDVVAVLDHLEVKEKCHVWGHSLGVDVAIELAAAEPRRCKSLTLCCGTVRSPFKGMFGTDALDTVLNPLLQIYPGKAEYFNLVWRLFQTSPRSVMEVSAMLLGFNMDASSFKQDVDTYAKSVVSMDPRTFFLLLRELAKGMTEALVPKVTTPTLVITGTKDHITPPDEARAFVAKLKRGKYVEIPAGSHNVQLDFGEYVCMKAEEFWKEEDIT